MSKSEAMAAVPHPSDFIAEEMLARGWCTNELAERMAADQPKPEEEYLIWRMALDLYDCAGPEQINCRIGQRMADALSRAFGVSAAFFLNLEAAWLRSKGIAA